MADNPIKYSDFIQPDDSVSNLIAQLETLQATYEAMLKEIREEAKKTEDALKRTAGATKDNQDETRKAAEEAEKLKKANDDLNKSRSDNAKQIASLKAQQQKQNQVNKLTAKLNESLEGSYDKLSAQYSLNKIRLNAMSKAEREATEEGKALEKQTAEIYKKMKRLQEATGKHTLSVGDYEKGWKGVAAQLGEMPGAAGAAAGGLQGLGTQAKKLLANPIILLIAGIVAGLTALFKLFKKTKAGSDFLAKAGAALNGVFSILVGVVDKLIAGFKKVFEDPKKAMKDFWEALKKNIVNRLTAVIDLVKALGKSFKALWERDMEGLKNAAKDAGTALIQMQTGLDAEQQQEFAQAIQNTTKSIVEQVSAFAQLEETRRNNIRTNRELEKQLETLITQEELLNAIADDATKSFKEREEAAKSASELTIKRAAIQQQIAKSNLDLINREIDLRSKNGEDIEDLLDQQLDAYKTLKGAQRDYLLSVRDNQKRESELIQDRLERDLDILIDGFDNQKTINERIIADDTRTFEERKKVLDQTKALFEDTFAKQIETIQQFTDIQIDANDLINESDAVALNQKIRNLGLSEIIEGRLLEIVRERRIATQDLAEAETDLNQKKAAADKKALADQEKLRKQQYDLAVSNLDQEYDLRLSEIDIMKTTEAEKTRLRLQAEKDRLQKILALNKAGEGELSKAQIEAVQNTIKKIQQEIDSPANKDYDLYALAGLKLDDEQKEAINISTQYAIDAVNTFLQAKIDAANASVEAADSEADAAQSAVDAEIEARNNGYASNVAQAQKELALAKKNQEQALKQQEKAQKAQAAIETLQQVGSLVTASAKIWATLGFPWAIPAIAVMFGSFAFAKIKAAQATKKQYAEGGYDVLEGGSHASGNDIYLGNQKGVDQFAEGGEGRAIFSRKSTKKYKHLIPDLVKSLNKGTFEKKYMGAYDLGGVALSTISNQADLTTLENDVKDIKKQGERRYFVDGKGRIIEVYKNLKRIYNAN